MTDICEVNNLTSFPVDCSFFSHAGDIIVKEEGFKGNISVAFVKEEEMRRLNRECRGKDYPTDVLSFPYHDEKLLGEVIICPHKSEDILHVFIHGVLHILGYNHINKREETIMKKKEDYYLNLPSLKIKRLESRIKK